MEKNYRQVESAVKALIEFIPGIGSSIGSLLNDALENRKEERLNNFLNSLKEDIEKNKQNVNQNFINKHDFLDVFEITAKKISGERSEGKREAFKNILLHGIVSPNSSYDDVESQIRMLDLLMEAHLILLSFLSSPKRFQNVDFKITKSSTYFGLLRQIFPNWDKDYLFDYFKDLENNRLIEGITNNFNTIMTNVTVDNLEGKLTSRGATFVSFIKGDKTI